VWQLAAALGKEAALAFFAAKPYNGFGFASGMKT